MVAAIVVGYVLVSAVPQQIALYTAPQFMNQRGDGELIEVAPEPGTDTITGIEEQPSEDEILGEVDEIRKVTFIETSQLPELLKWWTLDIMVALVIFWLAKLRLS
jgi:hypothetical protein